MKERTEKDIAELILILCSLFEVEPDRVMLALQNRMDLS
jgi:hypothetical protein